MLSERISTWRPIRSGRKNWQARQTANISKQLMWKPFSAFDNGRRSFAFAQRPPTCVGGVCRDNFPGVDQPHGHALLHPPWLLPGGQGCYTGLIHPDMQASMTPCVVWNPWFQPALKGAYAEQAPAVTLAMLRPYRPSILWNTLSGRAVSLLKVAASFWMARARSGAITALMRAESRTVPRNDTRWLGDSALLAKLTLSPRRSKWLRMRVLCESSSTSDWARMSQSSR